MIVSAPAEPIRLMASPSSPKFDNTHAAAEKVPAAVSCTSTRFTLALPVIVTLFEMPVPPN